MNNEAGHKPLTTYVKSVDYVEEITGLDFFSLLPNRIEKKVESTKTQDFPFDYETIPEWVLKEPPACTEKPLPLSPSKLVEQEESEQNRLDRVIALKRGTFIHQMLQYLPTIPPKKRPDVLAKLTPKDIDVPENLLSIFQNPALIDLFGQNSLAEVPVIGTLEGQPFSGQIDRLVIKEKEVLIVDFKTNRFVPKTVPQNYQQQLLAYKDLLKNIFPDKMIKSYLLWTENMTLMEV